MTEPKMSEDEIIIYKRGEVIPPPPKKIPPDLLQVILLDDIQVGISKLNRHMEKAEFEGKLDPRTIPVTDEVGAITLTTMWPFFPWITASFHNDGPDKAYILINYGDEIPLKKDDGIDMDFARGDERIYLIRYRCDSGETASVRVVGKY